MKRELFSKVLLKNSLVGISLDELENQMNSDSSLKELLTTEASDLPEELQKSSNRKLLLFKKQFKDNRLVCFHYRL